MANWVRTNFDVSGSEEDIAEFKRAIVRTSDLGYDKAWWGELVFDFSVIVPTPDGKVAEADWAKKGWGTAGEGFECEILSDEPGRLSCRFFTKDTAPVPVIKKLGKVFPKLTIDLLSYDVSSPVPNFAFEGRIENGRLDGLWKLDCETFWVN